MYHIYLDPVSCLCINEIHTLANGTITVNTVVTLDANQIVTNKDIVANSFTMVTNAALGRVLTSDISGVSDWKPLPDTIMNGDVTGTASASVVDTLANGTIPVNTLATLK